MKRLIWLLALVVVVSGCATASRMNNLKIGMTKQEALEIMGKPESASAKEGVEYLKYTLFGRNTSISKYYLKFEEGVLNSFGEVGDFGSQ